MAAMVSTRAVLALLCLAAGNVAAGCDRGPAPTPAAPPRQVAWQEVTLPQPAGTSGRIAVREATTCGGQWYVVGAVYGPDGSTVPAAWRSSDARTWQSIPAVGSTYYGKQAIMYTVGCRDGRVAVVGGKIGGAHGSPRVTSWYTRQDGTLVDMIAGFELYGGPAAINVLRLAGGRAGWLIAGNRVSGAAVWLSADSTDFRIIEGAPKLASEPGLLTYAIDGIAYRDGWVVVGGSLATGRIDRDPTVWTSTDGVHWQRTAAPGDDRYEDLHRVVAYDGGLVALGLHGTEFGTWRDRGQGWSRAGSFGSIVNAGGAGVHSLTSVGRDLFAAITDGKAYTLWTSTDGGDRWGTVRLPGSQPSGAERAMSVTAAGSRLLLLADDGAASHVWIADIDGG